MPTNRRCGLVFEKSKTLPLHFACLQSAVRQRLPKKRGPMAAIVHYGRPQSIVNARHFDGRPRKSRSMEGQRGERHGPARLLPPRPAVQILPSPKKKSHLRSPMHRLSEGTSRLKAPFGLLAATCPSHRRHMPMSTSPHAHVTLATCLCHFGEMPMSPPATCLCRRSEMPMSPK